MIIPNVFLDEVMAVRRYQCLQCRYSLAFAQNVSFLFREMELMLFPFHLFIMRGGAH